MKMEVGTQKRDALCRYPPSWRDVHPIWAGEKSLKITTRTTRGVAHSYYCMKHAKEMLDDLDIEGIRKRVAAANKEG